MHKSTPHRNASHNRTATAPKTRNRAPHIASMLLFDVECLVDCSGWPASAKTGPSSQPHLGNSLHTHTHMHTQSCGMLCVGCPRRLKNTRACQHSDCCLCSAFNRPPPSPVPSSERGQRQLKMWLLLLLCVNRMRSCRVWISLMSHDDDNVTRRAVKLKTKRLTKLLAYFVLLCACCRTFLVCRCCCVREHFVANTEPAVGVGFRDATAIYSILYTAY